MRLAALADVHGNLAALDSVLADLTRLGLFPAQIVVAGDIAMAGPQPAEVVTRLRVLEAAGAVIVGGNVDRWNFDFLPPDYVATSPATTFLTATFRKAQAELSVGDWQWLRHLPRQRRVPASTDLPAALVVHASPRDDGVGLLPETPEHELLAAMCGLPPDIGALICAHTHQPMVRLLAGRLIVNAGSVGRPYDGDERASYALVSYRYGRWDALVRRVRYDVEATVRAAREAGLPEVEWYARALRNGTIDGLPLEQNVSG